MRWRERSSTNGWRRASTCRRRSRRRIGGRMRSSARRERQLVIKTTRAGCTTSRRAAPRAASVRAARIRGAVGGSGRRLLGDGVRDQPSWRVGCATSSNTIGRTDTKTMPIVTSEKLFLTIGMLPKNQPAPRHKRDPGDGARPRCRATNDAGRHLRRAGHERHERPDDRHEPAEDDRLAAVLLEEGVRPFQVLPGSAAGCAPC